MKKFDNIVLKVKDIKGKTMFISEITAKVIKVIAGDSKYHYYNRFTGEPMRLIGRKNEANTIISSICLNNMEQFLITNGNPTESLPVFNGGMTKRVNGHGKVDERILEFNKSMGNYTNWLRKMNVDIVSLI